MITRRGMLFSSMVAAIGFMLPWKPRVSRFGWTLSFDDTKLSLLIRRWADGGLSVFYKGAEWIPAMEGDGLMTFRGKNGKMVLKDTGDKNGTLVIHSVCMFDGLSGFSYPTMTNVVATQV